MTTEPARSRQPRSEHRAESQWQSTFRSSDGRWIMHREMRTDDGGVIGISTDITALKIRQDEAEQANETAKLLVSDLERTLDSLRMGVVLLDASLTIQVVNKEFYDIWKIGPADVSVGSAFRTLMDVNRHKGIYDVADDNWEDICRIAPRRNQGRRRRAARVRPRRRLHDDLFGHRTFRRQAAGLLLRHHRHEAPRGRTRGRQGPDRRTAVEPAQHGRFHVDRHHRSRRRPQDRDHQPGLLRFVGDPPRRCAGGVALPPVDGCQPGRRTPTATSDAEWEAHVAERQAEIRSGTAASRELSRADGHTMICTMAPLAGGKRLVSYLDVTEMKQREAELADALERSKLAEAVIDGVRDPVFVKDSELNFVIATAPSPACSASSPRRWSARATAISFRRRRPHASPTAERQVLSTGEALEFEEDPEFSGTGRTRIVRKNRVRTASGKDYVSCFLFDVTEIKRREVEANEARKQLADVLERMPAGVVIYDRDDNFVFANRKLQESLPALRSIWTARPHSARRLRSRAFRRLFPLQRRSAGRRALRRRQAKLDRCHNRPLSSSSLRVRTPEPGWPMVPGLRHAHRRRHLHRGARRHHRAQAARKGAARLDAADRPVPARARRAAGGSLHQGGRSARRIRQQGLELDYRHFQGGGCRAYRSRIVRRRRCPGIHRCRCRGQHHRQGRREGRAGRPSRRHRQAADDPQEPAGGDRRIGAHGRIEHRHNRHEGARGPAQPEPAGKRGVSQPDRQCARGDLRQASRPQAVLRQQGLVRPDRA